MPVKLECVEGPPRGRSVEVLPGKPVPFQVRKNAQVAGHVLVELVAGQLVLTNRSPLPCLINGVDRQRSVLRAGDRVQIGPNHFIVHMDEMDAGDTQVMDGPIVVLGEHGLPKGALPGTPRPRPAAKAPAPAPARAGAARLRDTAEPRSPRRARRPRLPRSLRRVRSPRQPRSPLPARCPPQPTRRRPGPCPVEDDETCSACGGPFQAKGGWSSEGPAHLPRSASRRGCVLNTWRGASERAAARASRRGPPRQAHQRLTAVGGGVGGAQRRHPASGHHHARPPRRQGAHGAAAAGAQGAADRGRQALARHRWCARHRRACARRPGLRRAGADRAGRGLRDILDQWHSQRERIIVIDAEIAAIRRTLGLGPDPEAVLLPPPTLRPAVREQQERAFATLDGVGTETLGSDYIDDAPASGAPTPRTVPAAQQGKHASGVRRGQSRRRR